MFTCREHPLKYSFAIHPRRNEKRFSWNFLLRWFLVNIYWKSLWSKVFSLPFHLSRLKKRKIFIEKEYEARFSLCLSTSLDWKRAGRKKAVTIFFLKIYSFLYITFGESIVSKIFSFPLSTFPDFKRIQVANKIDFFVLKIFTFLYILFKD